MCSKIVSSGAREKPQKGQYWACVLYPESCPDWADALEGLHVPCVAILHDRDTDPETGELKKPHVHVLLEWSGATTAANALNAVGGLPIAGGHLERVRDFVAYCRYLLHLDSPAKAQYDEAELLSISGAWYELERAPTLTEQRNLCAEITTFIRDYSLVEYSELVFYALDNRPEWLPYISSHTIYFAHLLQSARFSSRRHVS